MQAVPNGNDEDDRETRRVTTVIMHANWEKLDNVPYIKTVSPGSSRGVDAFKSPLMKTLEALSHRNINIIIIGSHPTADVAIPYALAKKIHYNEQIDLRPSRELFPA